MVGRRERWSDAAPSGPRGPAGALAHPIMERLAIDITTAFELCPDETPDTDVVAPSTAERADGTPPPASRPPPQVSPPRGQP
jgi:hypothetical protein